MKLFGRQGVQSSFLPVEVAPSHAKSSPRPEFAVPIRINFPGKRFAGTKHATNILQI